MLNANPAPGGTVLGGRGKNDTTKSGKLIHTNVNICITRTANTVKVTQSKALLSYSCAHHAVTLELFPRGLLNLQNLARKLQRTR